MLYSLNTDAHPVALSHPPNENGLDTPGVDVADPLIARRSFFRLTG
jgi:hypothetical protein